MSEQTIDLFAAANTYSIIKNIIILNINSVYNSVIGF